MFKLPKRLVLRIARLLIRLVNALLRVSALVAGLGLLFLVLDSVLLRNTERPD